MTVRFGKNAWLALVAILAVALLTYAWADGGVRELTPVVESVVLPELSR